MTSPFSPPANDTASVLSDARWIPGHFDAPSNRLQFHWLPREAQQSMSFLADEYLRNAGAAEAWVGVGELKARGAAETSFAHYIFHSAFSCSTLLARALDLPGVSLALREPQILNELAALSRGGAGGDELLRRIAGLLARPFAAGEAVVIKPSNVVNNLAGPLLQLDSRTRAIFLYAPLPRFLRSVARKGMWGRIWARRLFAAMRRDPGPSFGFSDAELFEQTDLQIAALGWLQQHAHFMALMARFPGRILTLDSETFLSAKEQCLIRIGDFFALDARPEDWASVAGSSVFSTHSKELGREFLETEGALPTDEATAFDDEIEMLVSWAESVARHIGMSIAPPQASRVA